MKAHSARRTELTIVRLAERSELRLHGDEKPLRRLGNVSMLTGPDDSATHTRVHARRVVGHDYDRREAAFGTDVDDDTGNVGVGC